MKKAKNEVMADNTVFMGVVIETNRFPYTKRFRMEIQFIGKSITDVLGAFWHCPSCRFLRHFGRDEHCIGNFRLLPCGLLAGLACWLRTLARRRQRWSAIAIRPRRRATRSAIASGFRESVEPDVVIIGIHGFCGASIDYANLGNHLLATSAEDRRLRLRGPRPGQRSDHASAAAISAIRGIGIAICSPSPSSSRNGIRMRKSSGSARAWVL